MTINTQKGLFHTRLPFGVSSAPAIFQRIMDNLLQGIPQVCVYLDDILVTGKSTEEPWGSSKQIKKCRHAVEKVLMCLFASTGRIPGSSDIRQKLRAIVEAPTPHNVTQLKSFLWMINYYSKILTKSLHLTGTSLQFEMIWSWGKFQTAGFWKGKAAVSVSTSLGPPW